MLNMTRWIIVLSLPIRLKLHKVKRRLEKFGSNNIELDICDISTSTKSPLQSLGNSHMLLHQSGSEVVGPTDLNVRAKQTSYVIWWRIVSCTPRYIVIMSLSECILCTWNRDVNWVLCVTETGLGIKCTGMVYGVMYGRVPSGVPTRDYDIWGVMTSRMGQIFSWIVSLCQPVRHTRGKRIYGTYESLLRSRLGYVRILAPKHAHVHLLNFARSRWTVPSITSAPQFLSYITFCLWSHFLCKTFIIIAITTFSSHYITWNQNVFCFVFESAGQLW